MVFFWWISIGPTKTGGFFVRWSISCRCLYVMTVTLNSPKLKVGSIPSTQHWLGSVQNLLMSLSCQLLANKHMASGAAWTIRKNGSTLDCCCLHSSMTENNGSFTVGSIFILLLALATCFLFLGNDPQLLAFKMPPCSMIISLYTLVGPAELQIFNSS